MTDKKKRGRKPKVKKEEDIVIDNHLTFEEAREEITNHNDIIKKYNLSYINDEILRNTLIDKFLNYDSRLVILALQRCIRVSTSNKMDERTILTLNLKRGVNPHFLRELNKLVKI